jgi:rhomboid-like protein
VRFADFQTRGRHSTSRPGRPLRPSNIQNQETQDPEIILEANHEGYQHAEEEPQFPNVRVRFLRPAIFAFSVSTVVYVSLAYVEAKKELKPRRINDYVPQWSLPRRTPPTPTEVVTRTWDQLNPMAKLSCSLIGVNSAIHLTKFVAPQYWSMLWHMPARNVNYTLLTSTFVHGGPLHLGINMYAAWNFLPAVGYSKLFREDTNHVISFYITAGLLSGYAQHVAGAVFRQGRAIPPKFIPSGGASGALFAILGVFCTQYPDSGIGIMFVPYYADAQYVLPVIMLFDLVGMVRGYSFVNLGHAVCYTNNSDFFY